MVWPALYGEHGGGHGYAAVNCLNPWDTQQSRVFSEDGSAPTMAGADGGGGRNPCGLVCAAFCGGASAQARSIGYSEEPTLSTSDHHMVAAFFNQHRSGSFLENHVAGTQTARQCKDATDLICETQCLDVSAVDCRNCNEIGDVSGTLQAKDTPGYSLNYQNHVPAVTDKSAKYIVRRLTPTECERLQGFPDGWTKHGHDGKEISDTRRYQMLGNSLAIPCVAFVLGGIAAQTPK